MFTGIVRETGTVREIETTERGSALTIACRRLLPGLEVGQSVCVNGVCLTVESVLDEGFRVTATPETLRRSGLGGLAVDATVNLEPSLRLSDPLGGHLVQGHVDGVGAVATIRNEGNSSVFRYRAPESVLRHCVLKGSIAVDGVSLTISGLDPEGFETTLIPHTLAVTRFSALKVGDEINLEVDIVSKYVETHVQRLLESSAGRTSAGDA